MLPLCFLHSGHTLVIQVYMTVELMTVYPLTVTVSSVTLLFGLFLLPQVCALDSVFYFYSFGTAHLKSTSSDSSDVMSGKAIIQSITTHYLEFASAPLNLNYNFCWRKSCPDFKLRGIRISLAPCWIVKISVDAHPRCQISKPVTGSEVRKWV